MAARRAVAHVPGAVLLRDLRIGQLARLAAHRRAVAGVRLGAPNPVPRLDDHPVLVDQRVLWAVTVRLRHQGRARHPRAPLAHRAGRGGDLLHPGAAALHFHAAGDARLRGLFVCGADRLRQAVQPGAVAAHRLAGDPVGAVRPARPALGAVAAAPVVSAGRRLGAHDLSASLHRYPDRRVAWLCLSLAVARPRTRAALGNACHARSSSPGAGRALRGRRRRHRRAVRFGSAARPCGCSGRRSRSCWWRRTTRCSAQLDSRKVRMAA